jgi:hypothetical protein
MLKKWTSFSEVSPSLSVNNMFFPDFFLSTEKLISASLIDQIVGKIQVESSKNVKFVEISFVNIKIYELTTIAK